MASTKGFDGLTRIIGRFAVDTLPFRFSDSQMLKPRDGSLIALLLRSPWWASVLLALALFFGVRLMAPDIIAFSMAMPFIGIAGFVGWRSFNAPNPERTAEAMERLRGMGWPVFSDLMANAFRRGGYEVSDYKSGGADLELRKDGYVTLVSCKRWKVAQAGVGPVKELLAAQETAAARDCIYVTAGELSPQASALVAASGVRVIRGVELVQLAV